ncbi:MAG: AAA family ATPase [Patescibacteria group bacterium]
MFNRDFEKYLISWKNSSNRKPLVVRGARQVGKTVAVKEFGEKFYTNFIYINLENKETLKLFESVDTIGIFASTVNLAFQQNVEKDNTLIFIDEIQNSPNLISLLRFFYEEMPALHIICAGSLLEAKIEKEGFSMPVGRVEYGYMYPLTFFEFLGVIGKDNLRDHIINLNLTEPKPLPAGIHNLAISLFRQYTLLGGMPEVLKIYSATQDLEECKKVLRNISTAYSEDVYKYAGTETSKYLNFIITVGSAYAGSLYRYENFAESGFRSREMGNAFDLLEKVMLLRQIRSTNSNSLPLMAKERRSKKLVWLDVGFVNMTSNAYESFINLKDLNGLYRGRIAEQVVGQNILASGNFYETMDLYYWSKDQNEGIAEVDFCLQVKGRAVAVEVKSGSTGKARSLKSFGDIFKDALLVKVSEANFGKQDGILLLPFYLVNRISAL